MLTTTSGCANIQQATNSAKETINGVISQPPPSINNVNTSIANQPTTTSDEVFFLTVKGNPLPIQLKLIKSAHGDNTQIIDFTSEKSPVIIMYGITQTSQIQSSFYIYTQGGDDNISTIGSDSWTIPGGETMARALGTNYFTLDASGHYRLKVQPSGCNWWVRVGVENPDSPISFSTKSSSFVMVGLAVPFTSIPNWKYINIYGTASNNIDTGSGQVQIVYGTGEPPRRGSNPQGTVLPSLGGTQPIKNQPQLFSVVADISDLTSGETYWFDLQVKTIGQGTVYLSNIKVHF